MSKRLHTLMLIATSSTITVPLAPQTLSSCNLLPLPRPPKPWIEYGWTRTRSPNSPSMASSCRRLPSNATMPKGFSISLGGVPVRPLPKGKEFAREVFQRRQKEAMWLDPQYNSRSPYRPACFLEDWQAASNHFIGEHHTPEKNKAKKIVF